jgi:hypothetical protein
MLNFFNRPGQLDTRVHDAVAVFEERRQVADADVAILVDGRAQDCSTVLFVPFGIVTSATEE